jgi:hypothetical protein
VRKEGCESPTLRSDDILSPASAPVIVIMTRCLWKLKFAFLGKALMIYVEAQITFVYSISSLLPF